MAVMESSPAAAAAEPALRRELKLLDAAAFSVGLIGPVGAAALLGVGAAGILGRAADLAFVFALVGVTLGPRAGFLAGWALLGAYVAIGAGSGIEIGLFLSQFLSGLGVLHTTEWVVIAVVALGVVSALAFAEIHVITRALLITELIGVVLVTLLSLVIIVRLAVGHAPHGQSLDLHFLALPSGSDLGTIASAAVFLASDAGAAITGEDLNVSAGTVTYG